MVQLNNTSSSHSPSSCSRDRTCQWEPHAECYHQGRRQLSWLAAERWALLASCYSTFHPLDISALVCHFYLLHRWPLLKFHYSCLTMYLCVSLHCQGPQMEMKGFQFSEKPNHSPGMSGGSYRWVEIICRSFYHFRCAPLCNSAQLANSFVLLLFFFYIRPSSASPGGKPSGPGGPVGPLPTHFAQQVWIFHLKILPYFFSFYATIVLKVGHTIYSYMYVLFSRYD